MSSKLVIAELAHEVEKLKKHIRKEKRLADGERVKREPNEYAKFISKHINSMSGSTPQQRLTQCAKLFKEEHEARTRKVEHRKAEPKRKAPERKTIRRKEESE